MKCAACQQNEATCHCTVDFRTDNTVFVCVECMEILGQHTRNDWNGHFPRKFYAEHGAKIKRAAKALYSDTGAARQDGGGKSE